MVTILDELQMSNEKASAVIIPYLHDRSETIDQHINAALVYANPSTPLLFASKANSHVPEAGLNPLVDAAAYLFYLMGKLKTIKEHRHLAKLHDELLTEVRHFQERVKACRYNVLFVEEFIPTATYALCITLDDLISETTWGGHGKWQQYSVVTALFGKGASQKSFFIILERLTIDPNAYIDVVEFLYLCLSFGLKCRDATDGCELSHEQNGHISNYLFRFIQACRGNHSKALSPFPIRAKRVSTATKFSLKKMFYTIGEYTETWLTKLKSFRRRPSFNVDALTNPELIRSLQSLESRVNSAICFIKKTTVPKNGMDLSLDELPWYLLIGMPHSGKSSLLAKSNINFILGKKAGNRRKRKTSEVGFDWWITSGAVLVDVPGCYTALSDMHAAVNREIWQHFLSLVQKDHQRKAFGGIIVTIAVTELTDRHAREELLQNLQAHIHDIQQAFGTRVPFYFSITKMDLLPGFTDFFQDCSAEELLQAWGITMPSVTPHDAMSNIFIRRFNALIKILNHQVIQRLHHERNHFVKSNIKDFPLYVERVKDEFASMLNALQAQDVRFNLRGVYLTSAEQNHAEPRDTHHPATLSLGETSEKVLDIMHGPAAKQAPYFIKQFLLQGIMQ